MVERALTRESHLPPSARIAVAVSGGPDSMALCDVMRRLQSKMGFELLVLSIDHGLRAEAVEEVAQVSRFCAQHQLAFESRSLSLKPGGNLQERARTERYAALFEMSREQLGPDAFLATAHQLEDRAETVLMRLLRGSSLEGLGVLLPRQDRLLRPMIRASRQQVLAHVERHAIPVAKDPSNLDTRFLRVRVRHELLPLLEELGGGVAEHLAEIADDAARLGEPLGLNREQRSQLRQALREPQRQVNLPLPGGLLLSRPKPGAKGD